MTSLSPFFYWTGVPLWALVVGALVWFIGAQLIPFLYHNAVFAYRIQAAQKRLRTDHDSVLKLWWWAIKSSCTAVDVLSDDKQKMMTIDYPGATTGDDYE